MRSIYAALIFIILSNHCTFADDLDSNGVKPKFGFFGHYAFNIHTANISDLDEIPSCCQDGMAGNGNGFDIGAFVSYHVFDDWEVQIRLGFSEFSSILSQQEETTVSVIDPATNDFKSETGLFKYILNTKFDALTIEPLLGFKAADNLYVYAGVDFGILLIKDYDYVEKIIKPDNGYFPNTNRSRSRNYKNDEFADASGMFLGFSLGTAYQLRMNKDSSLFLSPELFYTMIPTPIVNNTGWLIHDFRGGLSLKYLKPPPPPPPPDPPAESPLPPYPGVEKPAEMSVDITVAQLDSLDNISDKIDIKIEDFVSHNMSPLLNYVFFDENSSELPDRYKRFTEEETKNFHISELQKLNVLETYYTILNIVGLRMRQDSSSKITLTGTNSYTGAEKQNLQLSRERAETVKKYLVETWKIDPKRINVKARHLPEEPSNVTEAEGEEENRRVEIESTDWKIVEPVIAIDTTRTVTRSTIRFYPTAKAEAGIRNWKVVITQNNIKLKEFEGLSDIPEHIDWLVTSEGESAPMQGGSVSYGFIVEDSLGQVAATGDKHLNVEQLTIEKKRIEKVFDREYEYYSLILFDYGKHKLRGEHKKVIDFIKERLKKNSKVIISGHTDVMGRESLNKRIAESRAKAVAQQLSIPDAQVVGVGEDNLLYDNSTPEGRFYCRTVRITIETPVENQ